MVTVYLFEWADELGQIENKHKGDIEALEKVIDDEDEYDSLQAVYLDNIYGCEGSVKYEAWHKANITKNAWLYDPAELRKKIFEYAKIELQA